MKRIIWFIILVAILCTFLIIPIGNISFAEKNNEVYLGGTPLGVLAQAEGIIITDYVDVVTEGGVKCPAKDGGLLIGDMIVNINNKRVTDAKDIKVVVDKEFVGKNPLKVAVVRDNMKMELEIVPCMDASLKEYKIGIIGKNDIAGVGTLTFIRKDYRFGGLGHRIYDSTLPQNEFYKTGKVFDCTILGIVKGKEGKAGELRGLFDRKGKDIGSIDKNTNYGIYGYLNKDCVNNHKLIELGIRGEVKMGKAFVYTTIDGNEPDMYSIEIIKNIQQANPEQKGMVIRITDERLLDKTAGIVQGMSGSPIIQDDKLIGAVTHVFINDPTKGYGVYIDWMINN